MKVTRVKKLMISGISVVTNNEFEMSEENGKIAGMSITMDRYKDDQVLQILNDEFIQKDRIISQRGLFINDFPTNSNLETRNKAIQEAQKISDEKTRNEKLSQIYHNHRKTEARNQI